MVILWGYKTGFLPRWHFCCNYVHQAWAYKSWWNRKLCKTVSLKPQLWEKSTNNIDLQVWSSVPDQNSRLPPFLAGHQAFPGDGQLMPGKDKRMVQGLHDIHKFHVTLKWSFCSKHFSKAISCLLIRLLHTWKVVVSFCADNISESILCISILLDVASSNSCSSWAIFSSWWAVSAACSR